MLMSTLRPLGDLEDGKEFHGRHIGPNAAEQLHMLSSLGYANLSSLRKAVVPESIARKKAFVLPAACTEQQALAELKVIAKKNILKRNFIGQGYYPSITPTVILRNVLENPAWYTAYTPYQPEISQGRLEALINFQTMVCDLTGMAISNASMLDEATAAAEAMSLLARTTKSKSNVFYVADDALPQTLEVIQPAPRRSALRYAPAQATKHWTTIALACCCSTQECLAMCVTTRSGSHAHTPKARKSSSPAICWHSRC
jgi:glycine dehydrogenase